MARDWREMGWALGMLAAFWVSKYLNGNVSRESIFFTLRKAKEDLKL